MNNQTSVTIKRGTNKETGREWAALLITVGDWSQMIFPKSKFEMDYIIKTLETDDTKVNVTQK